MSEEQVRTEQEQEQTPPPETTPEEQEQTSESKTNGKTDGEGAEEKQTDKTIAAGGDKEAEQEKAEKDAAPYWPEDWREKMAEHYAAGDQKAYQKELKRLQRFTDPTAVYGMGREAESKLTSGNLVKVPSKDASEEEIQEFHKALGVPEKPEEYLDQIQLENGAVIGDADKPMLEDFAKALHQAGAPPSVMNAAANWYYKNQEEQAAQLDETDEKVRREAEQELKEEYGNAYRRMTNAISSIFSTAPGGTDLENENSLYARLMGGRMADGKMIGNDPDMVRFLVNLTQEVNPTATVAEDGDQRGKSVDAELAEIDKFRRENRRAYFKDEKMQARERELLEARNRMQARQRT